MRIFNLPEISAIYYALLQCGYPYYALDRDASLVEAIERFQLPPDSFDTSFFSEARQNSCEAYEYWPRAALLEDAAFLINRSSTHQLDFDIYRDLVMGASNLTESDRNHLFWKWVAAFPSALNCVLNSENFKTYFRWESKWIKQQNSAFSNNLIQLQKILDKCIKYYPTSVQKVSLFLNPIKCACSADYHIKEDCLFFSSGAFRESAVLHEFLHVPVHRCIRDNREQIVRHLKQLRIYPDMDRSYELSGDVSGTLNVFEEYAVRRLTEAILRDEMPEDLNLFLRKAAEQMI